MDHRTLFERCVRPGDTVFDVGAHIGRYGVMFARLVGPTGAVYCFEPNPGPFARLSGLAMISGHGSMHPLRQAVGETPGRLPLFFSDEAGHEQASTISRDAAVPARLGEAIRSVEVEVTTIDLACATLGASPAFLKIDVEGGEIQVLHGGRTTIARCLPTMLIETDDFAAVRSELAPLGYELFAADVFVFSDADMVCSEHPQMRDTLITIAPDDDAGMRNCLFNVVAVHRSVAGVLDGAKTVAFARRREFLRAPQTSRIRNVKAWLRHYLPDRLVWRVRYIRERVLSLCRWT